MGWAFALVLAAAAAAALILPVRGVARLGAAAAVLVALLGYAWQGSPGLAAAPQPRGEAAAPPPTLFTLERTQWMGEFGDDNAHLLWAETLERWGMTDRAIAMLQAALARRPTSAILYLGLANALVVKSEGNVPPAAALAFERAARFAPTSPAPAYFLGLALIQAGRFDEASGVWHALLSGPLPGAEWRAEVGDKLARLDALRATAGAGQAG